MVVPRIPDRNGPFSGPPHRLAQLELVDRLDRFGRDRFAIFDLENEEGTPIYVHAKTVVVDDTWAAVGSDNLNRRSWTHDSELSCAIIDADRDEREPSDPGGHGDGARGFARDLRLTLMREHLGLDDDDGASSTPPRRSTGRDEPPTLSTPGTSADVAAPAPRDSSATTGCPTFAGGTMVGLARVPLARRPRRPPAGDAATRRLLSGLPRRPQGKVTAHDEGRPAVSGEDVEAKGEANVQAGAVRELAGRMKGDRKLEAKGLAQQVKGWCRRRSAPRCARPPGRRRRRRVPTNSEPPAAAPTLGCGHELGRRWLRWPIVAGVDLGGTKIQTIVVHGDEVLGQAREPTPRDGAAAVAASVVDSVRASLADAGVESRALSAVGIGAPGRIRDGVISNSPNMPGMQEPFPMGAAVSRISMGSPCASTTT